MAKANGAISLGISALIVIVLIIVVGFGVYLNATFNTTNTTYILTQCCITTSVGNSSTTSSSSESAQTSQQVTIQTTQEPTVQNFGSNYFEPPSGILIPANTLIWTNFRLNVSTYGANDYVAGTILYFPFPNAMGANITVAIYLNGILNTSSTLPVFNHNYGIASSLIPSSNSSNSIFGLTGVTPDVGMGAQTSSAVSLSGTTIAIAVMTDQPVWLAGWSQQDMTKGTGAQFGRSVGQLEGTFETPESGTSLPPNLPAQPTTSLTFELQIPGALMP